LETLEFSYRTIRLICILIFELCNPGDINYCAKDCEEGNQPPDECGKDRAARRCYDLKPLHLPYPQFRLPGFSRELLQSIAHFNNSSRQFRLLALKPSLNLSGKTKRNFTLLWNIARIGEETLTSLGYLRYLTLSF
jgi:hypothetical protein